MNIASKIVIPFFILFVILSGFKKKLDIYNSFLNGAREGAKICLNIFPSIMAMTFAINIFLDSNFIYKLLSVASPIFLKFHIPLEILPMAILRPISGTATLTIMNNIFYLHNPDSFLGNLASVIQGCTDTTIYVLALYFGSIGIKKTRYSLVVGLFADFVGIVMAFVITYFFFTK